MPNGPRENRARTATLGRWEQGVAVGKASFDMEFDRRAGLLGPIPQGEAVGMKEVACSGEDDHRSQAVQITIDGTHAWVGDGQLARVKTSCLCETGNCQNQVSRGDGSLFVPTEGCI